MADLFWKRLREFPSSKDTFNAIRMERVDAIFLTPAYLKHFNSSAQKPVSHHLITDSTTTLKVGVYVSKSRLSEKERKQIEKILGEIKKDKTLKSLASKYVDQTDLRYYY